MAKEIHLIDQQLVENLRVAKANLAIAQQAVIDAESAIYSAGESILPEKGTTHFEGVTVVTKVYEKWNDAELSVIEQTWPTVSNLPFPFKKTYKADGRSVTYIRENAKPAYDILAKALTVTPAKPSFELKGE